jgi:hypothetical protein
MRNNNLFENTKYYIENNDAFKNWITERSIRYATFYWGDRILLSNNNMFIIFYKRTDNCFIYTACARWAGYSVEVESIICEEFLDKDTIKNRIYFLEKIREIELGLQ